MAKARKKEKKTRLRPPRTLQKKKNRKIRARSLSFLSLSLSLFHASAEDPPVAASAFLDRFFAAKRPEARAASAAAGALRGLVVDEVEGVILRERERVLRREKKGARLRSRDRHHEGFRVSCFFILTLSFSRRSFSSHLWHRCRSSPAYEEKKRPQKEEERRGADEER